MKLFIYDHCPFCVKARMIFGLKRLPIRLVTLLNDDETTPFNLIGQKWCLSWSKTTVKRCRKAWISCAMSMLWTASRY